MAVVPYTFANQEGQIPLSELDVNFANVKAFAETAGNVTGNVQANITAVGTLTTLTVSGNIQAGNISGNLTGNVTGNLAGNVTGNLTGNVTGNLTGNVTGNISGNLVVAGSNTQILFNDNGVANASSGLTFDKASNLLIAHGNIVSNSIFSSGSVTANLGITGNFLLSSSGNIGVTEGVTVANIVNGRATTVFFAGHAANLFMANVDSTTSIAGNLTVAGNTSITGNIIGGNISLTGNAAAPTAANGTNTTQIATTAFVDNTVTNRVPTGVITLWFGSLVSIPAGWALCNGANGTPDLRDKFVVGAGSTYAVSATGGSANAIVVSHTHTATSVVTDPGHNHADSTFNRLLQVTNTQTATTVDNSTGEPNLTSSGNIQSNTTGITVATTVNSTGTSGTNANLPPYYALAYIMKL